MNELPQAITAQQMRELDRRAVDEGTPSLTLMERAGKGTADLILKKYPAAKRMLIFCGKGNNGGDGFVIARYLWTAFKEVAVILMADPQDLKGDALVNYDMLRYKRAKMIPFRDISNSEVFKISDLLVDAMLGIGLNSEVTGDYRKAIEMINAAEKPVVSVDIPSGLDGDDGSIKGAAVRANLTATIAYPKTGMLKNQGPQHCGEICVVEIGLPPLDTPKGF